MADATAKINAVPVTAPAAADASKAPAPPFDIAKFAGIFAALGMAFGALATAVTKIFGGILNMPIWKTALAVVAVLLLISGPAMVLAWMKLRRRNIAPLLNANGWAVNAVSKISIPFGATLTDAAAFPKLNFKDPYAKAGLAPWKKWVISLVAIALVAGGLWLFNLLSWAGLKSPLPRYAEPEVVEQVVEAPQTTEAEVVADPAQ